MTLDWRKLEGDAICKDYIFRAEKASRIWEGTLFWGPIPVPVRIETGRGFPLLSIQYNALSPRERAVVCSDAARDLALICSAILGEGIASDEALPECDEE